MNEMCRRCIKHAGITLLAVAVILSTCFGTWSLSAYAEEGTDSANFKKIMNNNPPANYNASDMTNPYSNNTDKFTIVEDSELLLFRSFNVNDTAKSEIKNIGTSTYDGFTNESGNSMKISDDLESASSGWTSFTDTVYDKGEKDVEDYGHGLNFSQSIAFDPDGTGYKDHVAYVGFGGGGGVQVWVYDAAADTYGSMAWVGQSYSASDLGYFSSRKFLSITAGDYDNDGKDTFVIYFPGKGGDYFLAEYSCSGTSIHQKATSKSALHPAYAEQATLKSSASWKDKLGCDLTTGDFDSDGIDDLGVISFVQDPSTNDLTTSNSSLYTPYITAIFGGGDSVTGVIGSIFNSTIKQSIYASVNPGKDGNTSVCESMRSPSISAGDVNGDGYDEIIAGGYYSKVKTSEPGYSKSVDYDKITAENIVISRNSIDGSGCAFNVNGWTNGVVDNHTEDSYRNQLCVECVAFNGNAAAEKVFINGTVYEVKGGAFTASYTPDYFNENDSHIYGGVEPKSGSMEALAGVFDGNDQGREQLMVCYYMNEYGAITGNDFYFGLGAIFGADYDSVNIAGSYKSTAFNSWAVKNAGDTNNQRLSVCMAAVDRDHDSILGSFTSKEYVYTDPKVAAVLQAGPYFDDISEAGGYANGCETSYSISTGFSTGKSTGNSVSFGAGVAFSVEVSAGVSLDEEVKAGYSLDWNETFEDEVGKEYSTEWTTYGEDQVVISRIPVTVYNYKVYAKDKYGKDILSDDKAMAISVPGKPVYYTLSIDEYNLFADEYNTKLDSSVAEYNKQIDAAGEGGQKLTANNKLLKITKGNTGTGNHMPADTAGNPDNYWTDWAKAPGGTGTALSQSPMALGYSSGNQSSAFDTSKSHTESTEISHGFSFECQAMFGGGALGNSAKVGGYVSLDYLHSTGSFKTTTTGTSTSGTVENIDEAALLSAGMSKDIIRNYGFTWEFGTWRAPLTSRDAASMIKDEYTPFFGYVVYNVSQPPKAPLGIDVLNSDADSMHELIVSWNKSTSPLIEGYNLYVNEGGEFVKLNTSLIPVDTEEYIVNGLDSNTEYNFVLTSVGFLGKQKTDKGESSYSSEASGKTTRDSFALTLTGDRGSSVSAQAAGKAVNSGEKVAEDEAVSIEVSAKDGYTITSVILKRTGKDDKDITSADGKFNFAMTSDSEVVIKTERIQKSGVSIINYGSDMENSESLGKVTAAADGEEFDTGAEIYSDSIIFEAEPKDGYSLQKWIIKTPEKDDIEIKANGSSTYEFGPFAEEHEIIAVFVKSDDPSVNVKIETTCGDNGRIVVTDKNGTELSKDENKNAYIVNIGSELSFKAVPEKGYKLSSWSGDLAVLSNTTTEYTAAVYEDMSFGAAFYAPVKYKLAYGANDMGMGNVTGPVESETSVASGYDAVIKAEAKDGFRLTGWEALKGKTQDTISFTADGDGLVTSAEYALPNIKANSTVTAIFAQIEKYNVSINISGTGTGDVYLIKSDGTKVESGGILQYADKATLNVSAPDGSYLLSLTLNGEPAENGDEILATGDVTIAASYALIADDPAVSDNLVFTGEEQTGVSPGRGYTVTGNTATMDGEYKATAVLENGYVWSDGTSGDKEINWSIQKKKVAVPKAVKGLVYDKSRKTGVKVKEGYTITGNTAKNAGKYKATAKLQAGYVWSDGSTKARTINWSISKAKQPVTVTTVTKTIKKSKIHKKNYAVRRTIKVKGAKGKVTYTKLDPSSLAYKICKLDKKTGKIIMKKHNCKDEVVSHRLKVKVKVAATANYKAYTKTVYVKMKMVPVK